MKLGAIVTVSLPSHQHMLPGQKVTMGTTSVKPELNNTIESFNLKLNNTIAWCSGAL